MKELKLNKGETKVVIHTMQDSKPTTVAQLRRLGKVLDVLEAVEFENEEEIKTIQFEDSDYEILKQYFNNYEGFFVLGRKLIMELADKII